MYYTDTDTLGTVNIINSFKINHQIYLINTCKWPIFRRVVELAYTPQPGETDSKRPPIHPLGTACPWQRFRGKMDGKGEPYRRIRDQAGKRGAEHSVRGGHIQQTSCSRKAGERELVSRGESGRGNVIFLIAVFRVRTYLHLKRHGQMKIRIQEAKNPRKSTGSLGESRFGRSKVRFLL